MQYCMRGELQSFSFLSVFPQISVNDIEYGCIYSNQGRFLDIMGHVDKNPREQLTPLCNLCFRASSIKAT